MHLNESRAPQWATIKRGVRRTCKCPSGRLGLIRYTICLEFCMELFTISQVKLLKCKRMVYYLQCSLCSESLPSTQDCHSGSQLSSSPDQTQLWYWIQPGCLFYLGGCKSLPLDSLLCWVCGQGEIANWLNKMF